jgi:TetR/AcrR family transcriptional regulator, transcriptional repressor for nem operon
MLSKSDRTRQFIIEKAAPLFNRQGYAATSLNDLISATGLAKGGIYGNFSSKDEIAAEAFEYAMNKVREAIRFKMNQHASAQGKLLAILDFYHNYSSHPLIDGGCPLLNTATESDDNLPFLRERANRVMKEMLAVLEQLVAKGKTEGTFHAGVDEAAEAAFLFAAIEGGIMMSRLRGNPRMLNQVLVMLRERITGYRKTIPANARHKK